MQETKAETVGVAFLVAPKQKSVHEKLDCSLGLLACEPAWPAWAEKWHLCESTLYPC